MFALVRRLLRKTALYHPLRNRANRWIQARDLARWERDGRPVPPPHVVKHRVLRSYAEAWGLTIFVETGTHRGDTIEAMKGTFDRLYSVELSESWYREALERFRRDPNVHLFHGDSATALAAILEKIDRPALFWLDAHYWEGVTPRLDKVTPILEELDQILSAPDLGHVIVIDDARHFGTDPAYPTLEQLGAFVRARRRGATLLVEDDSIRVTPATLTAPR